MRLEAPDWQYDEFRAAGTDFSDPAHAGAYNRNMGGRLDEERRRVRRLGLGEGDTLVEFGCGTGLFAAAAAERCRLVHAVDVSAAMLDEARALADSLELRNIEFHHAGFLTYAHAGEPAGWIAAQFSFHHLPDFWKSAAVSRMRAMLAPEGRVYLRDVVFSFEPEEYAAALEHWVEHGQRPAEGGFGREQFASHAREEFSTFAWILEGLFERQGFARESALHPAREHAEYIFRKT
ncbi:MAG: putative methyltransferase [candidate division BRC1 bacterium ADurb.BinA364]|nr:MAG: putative methyltransferase [candidate division BRC1 bacterium ADurb.BinA364]